MYDHKVMAKRKILEVGYNRINKKAIKIEEVDKTESGWVDAKKYAPKRFELVRIKTNYRELLGWWTGQTWFLKQQKQLEKVLFWKEEPPQKVQKVIGVPYEGLPINTKLRLPKIKNISDWDFVSTF